MISATEFRSRVRNDNIRVSQIVHIALAVGVVAFLAVTVFVVNLSMPEEHPDDSLIKVLSMVLAMFAAGSYSVGLFLYNRGFAQIDF